MKLVQEMLSPAFTIALLAGIESLLSAVVSDGMIGDTHKSNAELIGQGLGNICSGIFGGIPATGAIARTAANVRNGGRTPVAGIVHCITLTIILLVLMPLAALIPMTTLAAVLLMWLPTWQTGLPFSVSAKQRQKAMSLCWWQLSCSPYFSIS